ncbi:MAG TPA: hypothetical protein VK157_03440 [Phycisphaerales bacterium]|nr:hypothetical protein [Phycisphaerales bacterium]
MQRGFFRALVACSLQSCGDVRLQCPDADVISADVAVVADDAQVKVSGDDLAHEIAFV